MKHQPLNTPNPILIETTPNYTPVYIHNADWEWLKSSLMPTN